MPQTIVEIGRGLREGVTSVSEILSQTIETIERENPRLNAFLSVAGEHARERARELDRELRSGIDRGPLHGIPVAVKDNLWTKGWRTTSGSRIFGDFVPDRNAAAIDLLESAGAIIVGKTNLHELAYGITSNNPHFGAVRNPHDPGRIPGGSSGGSGAAVAAGMVAAALGTDTGGSIRIPASFCGCVGLKPGFGAVDLNGCQPLGYTLDHIGPLASTVEDAGLVLQSLWPGFQPPQYGPVPDLRLGMPANFYFDAVSSDVSDAVRSAAERSGARLVDVRVPDMEILNVALRTILHCEASTVYEQWLDSPELFGDDVYALLSRGREFKGTDYVKARLTVDSFCRSFEELFESIDCLVTPTTPTTAPRIGQSTISLGGTDMDVRIATTSLVRAVNGLGLPAISVPCGRSAEGLPIGLQLISTRGGEAKLLRAGAAIEAARI